MKKLLKIRNLLKYRNIFLKPLEMISWMTNRILEQLTDIEWYRRRQDPKGSEMYFLFKFPAA